MREKGKTMNDKVSEIVEKIAENQARQKQNEIEQESNRANSNILSCQFDELKAALAEAKKLELRHGDYGQAYPTASFRIIAKKQHGEGLTCVGEDRMTDYIPDGITILGNIFDDLKAVAEPLTGFEVECLSHVGDKISVSLVDNETRPVFEFKYYHKGKSQGNCFVKIPDLILNLRRMQHTLRSKA